jgi:hypothetical protein
VAFEPSLRGTKRLSNPELYPGMDCFAADASQHLEKQRQGASSAQKKEQGVSPALKIVSTLFPRKFGFDLD